MQPTGLFSQYCKGVLTRTQKLPPIYSTNGWQTLPTLPPSRVKSASGSPHVGTRVRPLYAHPTSAGNRVSELGFELWLLPQYLLNTLMTALLTVIMLTTSNFNAASNPQQHLKLCHATTRRIVCLGSAKAPQWCLRASKSP